MKRAVVMTVFVGLLLAAAPAAVAGTPATTAGSGGQDVTQGDPTPDSDAGTGGDTTPAAPAPSEPVDGGEAPEPGADTGTPVSDTGTDGATTPVDDGAGTDTTGDGDGSGPDTTPPDDDTSTPGDDDCAQACDEDPPCAEPCGDEPPCVEECDDAPPCLDCDNVDRPCAADCVDDVPEECGLGECIPDDIPIAEVPDFVDTGVDVAVAGAGARPVAGGWLPRGVAAGRQLPFTGPGDIVLAVLGAIVVIAGGFVAWQWAGSRDALDRMYSGSVQLRRRRRSTGYLEALADMERMRRGGPDMRPPAAA